MLLSVSAMQASATTSMATPQKFNLGQVAPSLLASAREALRLTRRKEPTPTATGRLILVRHGQSVWNVENRFSGWANVDLSAKGELEAQEAAQLLLDEDDLSIDVCYCSVLNRSIRTAKIVLDQWEASGRRRPAVYARWKLNERHYGALTGLNKREALTSRNFDPQELRTWRASFEGKPPPMEEGHPHYSRAEHRYERLLAGSMPSDAPLALDDVPLTESLSDTRERVRPLWELELRPSVLSGSTVLVIGHANCLRSLISCIQPELNDAHLPSLGVPNALPLVYTFANDGEPLQELPGKCYVSPLHAHYLGEQCVAFSELDADGNGGLDAAELDDSEYCRVAFDATLQDLDTALEGALQEGDTVEGLDELVNLSEDLAAGGCGAQLLAEADGNNDGLVDFNEYMNWWAKLPERRRGMGGGGAGSKRLRMSEGEQAEVEPEMANEEEPGASA